MGEPKMDRSYGSSVLGKYRLIAELGHGGMAEVFLAVAQGPAGFSKLSVIKQIRPVLAEDPEFLTMFLDEARLAARLNHPNVVHTHEVGHEGNRYFIAMEFLEGQPLNRILHRVGRERFVVPMQLRVLIDVLAGLHYAHELADYDGTPLEVVHRDMTPHNVFVTYDGHVKIVDFGIAKAMNSSAETRSGVLKGKVAYMAPEQARGERVDRRADVFSVGVMLWEAAVGRRLWKGLPDIAILSKLGNGEIPSPRSAMPEVSPALDRIIGKALSIDREVRYPTAADLQSELEHLLASDNGVSSLRELGRLLAQQFAEDRARIKVLVEAQLRDVRALPTSEYQAVRIPVLDLPSSVTTGNGSPSLILDDAAKDPLSHTGPQARISMLPGSLTSANTFNAAPFQGRSRHAVFPLATAVGALIAVVSWILFRTPPAPPLDPTAAAMTSAAKATASAPVLAPAEVEIRVSATPPEARLFLDDEPIGRNPGSKRVPHDGRSHKLRVESPGYITSYRSIASDQDFMIEISLEKAPTAARSPGPVSKPPPAAPTEPEKRREPRSTRTLDTANPFANP